MKRSGRTLKQRLYGIKHLPQRLRRARFFRGHGVHSPYVYSIVRHVFMCSKLVGEDHALYAALTERGVAKRRAIQLNNLTDHCEYRSWAIDELREVDMIIATLNVNAAELSAYNAYVREHKTTLCIMSPYDSAERWGACREIVDGHPSTTVDNRAYLLVFNNHLPKQRFIL